MAPVGCCVPVAALNGIAHDINGVCIRVNHWGGCDSCNPTSNPIKGCKSPREWDCLTSTGNTLTTQVVCG